MNTDTLRYAGFGSRFASLLLDLIVMMPLILLTNWGSAKFRLFNVYYFLPGMVFSLFYGVYLVKNFGGTPGKLLVGIRIRKLDGGPVGYREAFLRYMPDFILGTLVLVAFILAIFHMSDVEYHSLTVTERSKRLIELAPAWYKPLASVQMAWIWGELIVLLTNRKRRALHDFIAGTVVVHAAAKTTPPVVANPKGP